MAVAHALFAARAGPVVLCRRPAPGVPAVESVPAPLLTLLLELGITPAELDVDALTSGRLVAWEGAEPAERPSPACAHVDRASLARALWRRAQECPDVHLGRPEDFEGLRSGARWLVDATGRRAVTAGGHQRPSPVWSATCCTVPRSDLDPTMRLAAGPTGYAYRLGSASWLTVGWVGPGPTPRRPAELRARLVVEGAGWLLKGVGLEEARWSRRVASLDLPAAAADPHVVAIGDAALARDALASQGVSIGLSDARLAAVPLAPSVRTDLEARRRDGLLRHLRSLSAVLATCRHGARTAWRAYETWVDRLAAEHGATSTVEPAPAR